MIIVRHLTGPRAGTEDRPDGKLDRIVFGRKGSCDVVFPAEATIISREHFALVRKPPGPSGHWTIELFGEPFVAVNGVPAEPGQRLPAEATLELGKHGGPSFRVHVEPDAAADNLPLTEKQEEDEGARVLADKARSLAAKAGTSARAARRIALAGLGAALIAGAAAGYFYVNAPKSGISAADRAHLLRAAFSVEAPLGRPEGTAFPIGPHQLATNAHIGELFLELHSGQHMVVRSPGRGGKTYGVIGVTIHPGFKAFDAFLKEDIRRAYAVANIWGVGRYDVAILRVAETLPPDAVLQLATQQELRALAPGSVIAMAGYPYEAVSGSGAQAYGATPELHIGTITNMTNFFFLPADFAHSQLIHDDLPSTGGASGSPIIDQSGHVIALRNAGSFYFLNYQKLSARIPSGVQINYGQRVDVLQHLLAGDADREIAADRSYWAKEYAVFANGLEAFDKILIGKIREAGKNVGLDIVRVSEAMGSFTDKTRIRNAKGEFQRQVEYPVTAAPGTAYVFIGYAHDGSDLQLWVYDGTELVAHAGTPADSPDHTEIPWTAYRPLQSAKLSVWMIHPKDKEATYTFQVYKVATKPKTALKETKVKGAAG